MSRAIDYVVVVARESDGVPKLISRYPACDQAELLFPRDLISFLFAGPESKPRTLYSFVLTSENGQQAYVSTLQTTQPSIGAPTSISICLVSRWPFLRFHRQLLVNLLQHAESGEHIEQCVLVVLFSLVTYFETQAPRFHCRECSLSSCRATEITRQHSRKS